MLLKLWLNRRQMIHIIRHRNEVPKDFEGKIDLSAHQKAADYTLAKTRIATLSTIIGSGVLVMLTLGGIINVLLSITQAYIAHDIWSGVALIMSVFILSHFIELPVDVYQTFKIEQIH